MTPQRIKERNKFQSPTKKTSKEGQGRGKDGKEKKAAGRVKEVNTHLIQFKLKENNKGDEAVSK